MEKPPISKKAQRILDALRDGERHGAELSKATKLWSGTLYPLLLKLEDEGVIKSEWESPKPLERPRRRYYSLA